MRLVPISTPRFLRVLLGYRGLKGWCVLRYIHFIEPSLVGNCCPAWMLRKLFCLSVCLIGESTVCNKMPSTQSHMYSQSFNSCPMHFSLVLESVLACPLVSLLGTWLALIALGKCFYAVLSRGEHLAGVT